MTGGGTHLGDLMEFGAPSHIPTTQGLQGPVGFVIALAGQAGTHGALQEGQGPSPDRGPVVGKA